MSRIRANNIVNGAGTGAPTFPNGAVINGITTITADVSTTGSNLTIGTGTTISNPDDNQFRILTNGSERVRINSNGRVGIGTDNPFYKLDVLEDSSVVARFARTGGQWAKVNITAGLTNGNSYITFGDPDGEESGAINYEHLDDSLRFETWNGTSKVERLRITTNGDTQVAAGSSLYLANGNLVFSTSGTGIDFQSVGVSSTTATSHILDDYEEGTWTIKAGSTYGSQPDTSGFLQEGSYVKIGKVVTLYINFNYNDSATSVAVDDYLVIYGIPFVTGGGTVTSVGSAWQYRGISTGNNAFWVVGGALYTSTNLYLGCTHVDGSVVYDRNIRAWVTYTVNA